MAEAAAYTVHIWNRTPQIINGIFTTPINCVWRIGILPPIVNFKPFGCEAFIHVQKERRIGAAGPRATRTFFIGYPKNNKGWRVWNPENNQIRMSADVTFNEGFTLANSKYALIKMQDLPTGHQKKKEAFKERLKRKKIICLQIR